MRAAKFPSKEAKYARELECQLLQQFECCRTAQADRIKETAYEYVRHYEPRGEPETI